MTEEAKQVVLQIARDFAMKGEFIASARLTNSIGEEPVWASWKIKQ